MRVGYFREYKQNSHYNAEFEKHFLVKNLIFSYENYKKREHQKMDSIRLYLY